MSDTAATTIRVEALDRARTFDTVDELAEAVEELLATRGSVFAPMELAMIGELARRANGQASADVHRIARQTSFHAPARPDRGPTPHDDKITEAEELLDEAEVAWIERRRELERLRADLQRRHAQAKEKGGSAAQLQSRIGVVNAAHLHQVHQAEEDVRQARARLTRARARLNALRLASDRWRYDQEARFHNPSEPANPLTLAELEEQRGE